jgi:hypothetical protein
MACNVCGARLKAKSASGACLKMRLDADGGRAKLDMPLARKV